jgi:hypothetical protein
MEALYRELVKIPAINLNLVNKGEAATLAHLKRAKHAPEELPTPENL